MEDERIGVGGDLPLKEIAKAWSKVSGDNPDMLASFIRRSDRCECHACVNGRVDGGTFRDVENALEVGDLGSSGIIGRTGHGPVAVRLPVSAISMAACG